ncbi:MAG: hypothetical protein IPM32_13450 [Ignavibacteriae bacterium]|nr:hypothetical protein [Ignavibacteriota bacterium]
MNYKISLFQFLIILIIHSCSSNNISNNEGKRIYIDTPYVQDYSIKYNFESEEIIPQKVNCDRNNVIQILAQGKLFKPVNGKFQYPGKLKIDQSYEPMLDFNIFDFIEYKSQFIYLTNNAILSNAWAGKIYIKHNLENANLIVGGNDFNFMLSNGKKIQYLNESKSIWETDLNDEICLSIKFSNNKNGFFILTETTLYFYSIKNNSIEIIIKEKNLTSFDISENLKKIVIGTKNGFMEIDYSGKKISDLNDKLPWSQITVIKIIDENIWFGSRMGAFMLKSDGKFNYYFGERWITGKIINYIENGPENSVLILSEKGLSQIFFEKMTLEEKAMIFEKQVRERHIRYGINSTVTKLEDNDLSTNVLQKADSDNLWTAMYLVSQLFRYKVTGSEEAKQNCYEAFEAMERLHTLSGIKGLFGRTIERSGYQKFEKEYRSYVEDYWYPNYNNNISWYHASEQWDWRGTASSDQTVGQIFAMTLIAEYIDDNNWKNRAIKILDDLMTYIVENDFNLVDKDGKPSLWGRWNPEYVNRFDKIVGDRKICSSNIIAFLQSAYHHTGKEIFKEKANYLINQHGYLENLLRPFNQIGKAPETADNWSKMLSEEWNHSDDEMYFLAYWALYPYAFDDSLKSKYYEAIKDHWEFLRPEKNSLWNFCYAYTGANEFDLNESIWHLKEWPLDMVQYETLNSHRKDIELLEPNFMGQLTKEVLPPDERPELKHNRSPFNLDAPDRKSELSAGDTFLLPYWMGRFLGVISEPKIQNN